MHCFVYKCNNQKHHCCIGNIDRSNIFFKKVNNHIFSSIICPFTVQVTKKLNKTFSLYITIRTIYIER